VGGCGGGESVDAARVKRGGVSGVHGRERDKQGADRRRPEALAYVCSCWIRASQPFHASGTVLSLLVVDPAFQRRGVGALLVSDGVARARAQGRPVVVSSSTQGVHLYTKLGFELRETCVVGRAGIEAPILVKEP
jgi:GNAT superfamily N-acetyltransferase